MPRRGVESLTNYESGPSGIRQRQATAGSRVTHSLRKRAIGHSSAVGHGGGSSHLQATKAGQRAPVSGRPRWRVELLTRYESGPSGTRQWKTTAGGRVTHLLRTQAIGRSSAAVTARDGSHSQATRAGHRVPVSGRPRRGIESLTSYE